MSDPENGRYGPGRNIDPEVGLLAGEGSEQAVPDRPAEAEGSPSFDVWKDVPSTDGRKAGGEEITYYGRPVVKEPTWIWAVPAYFYVGGAAGAAAVLGVVAEIADKDGLEELVARCRLISAIGDVVGTGLLIEDLGRPERFAHMLRVFRPTSPMSVGSWVLAVSSPASLVAAVAGNRRGILGSIGRGGGFVSGVAGLPLCGYTAVLLSNSAVPVWQAARRSLPLLFISGAMSSAASLLDLLELSSREERIVRRFGVAGKLGELASTLAVERDADEVAEVGRALREGVSGALWRAAKALTAASAALSLLQGRSRARRKLSGLLGTLGAVAVRFAVFEAGKRSAADPRATFGQQRAGRGGIEATGAAAVTGPDERRAVS